MASDLVSIIIPCYNVSEFVGDAVASALQQSYKACEVIAIDDGSTDGSASKIQAFGNRVRFAKTDRRGACAARNLGMQMAKGEWIQFLDADDVMCHNKVQVQLELCKKVGVLLMYAGYSTFEGKPPNDLQGPKHCERCRLGDLPCFMSLWSGIYHRSIFDKVGFWNESLSLWQDVEFNLRIKMTQPTVLLARESHYLMRVHKGPYRIASLKRSSDGIKEGLRSLNACEANAGALLEARDGTFRTMYERLLWLALRRGSPLDFDELIGRCQAHFPDDALFRRLAALNTSRTTANMRALALAKHLSCLVCTGRWFDFAL